MGQIISGIGGVISAKKEARLMGTEAELLDWQADVAIAAAKLEEGKIRREGQKIGGAQRASFGRAGVVTTEGSAGWVQEDTTLQIEKDALLTKYKGAIQSYQFRMEASAKRQAAKNKKTGAWIRFVGSVVSTVATYGMAS